MATTVTLTRENSYKPELTSTWEAELRHDDETCRQAAEHAITAATCTGSRGATYAIGSLHKVMHSATVTREAQ